jgi:mTERF domain-containing protein
MHTVRRLGGAAGQQPAFCGLLSVGPGSLARPPLLSSVSYQPSRALALTAARTDTVGLQYLQTRLGLDEPEMAAMGRRLLFCPDEDRIRSSLDGLQGHLGLSDDELRKMVRTWPAIISYSFEASIKPTLDALQGHLGLSGDELRKMVRSQPAIIGLSFEGNIKPTLDALQGHLGLSDDELRKMVRRLPSIIGYSFEGNIKPTLDALQGRLGLSGDELRKMVRSLPTIIGLSFEGNIKPRFDWLQQALGLDSAQLVVLLQKQGSLMSHSLDKSLVPNLAFWRACFPELADAELSAKVVGPSGPRQLAQSHGRLQERAALFDAQGIPRPLLWGKAAYTDEALAAWLAKRVGRA